MKTIRLVYFIAGVTLLSVPAWSLPVVLNGSFEQNVLASPFFGNAATVSNWTFAGVGDGPHWAVGYVDGSGSVTVAGAGNQFVTMGGGGTVGTGTWSQLVSGFTIGQSYRLTFMLASETGADTNQVVSASILGVASQNFVAPVSGANYWRNWGAFGLDFTAQNASETVQFSSTTVRDVGLDNVGISQNGGVPEPASWGLMGAGIGLLALLRHRLNS